MAVRSSSLLSVLYFGIIFKRRFKEGKTKGVFALLNKFRSDAMEQPGYVSGETLINYDDPHEIVVIAMWLSIDNWLRWKDNDLRKANEKQLEKWLEEPTEIKTYILGTYPQRK